MRAAAQLEPAAQEGAAAAGDSITVAAWTIVSRATGVLKFACIGAVLGPTFFGNTYQFTNSLPNLVYYGFLAGSLFSSLLVPALVRHIDAGEQTVRIKPIPQAPGGQASRSDACRRGGR